MLLMYGDDDLKSRDLVTRAVQTRGDQILTFDTSQAEELTARFKDLIKHFGLPDILILDGHNILLDKQGQGFFDMTPSSMIFWLKQNGLKDDCKIILYSNDDSLVEQARLNNALKFFDAIPKGGKEGGLRALLQAIDRAR